MPMSAAQIIDLLGLKPATCGFMAETYRSRLEIAATALPAAYRGDRTLGNVFYFLVTPDAPVRLHRIRSDQMYHYYLGSALEVALHYDDDHTEIRMVGPDLAAGMQPQLFIRGGTFHEAHVPEGAQYALLGTSVWLRAEPADVEMGDPQAMPAHGP